MHRRRIASSMRLMVGVLIKVFLMLRKVCLWVFLNKNKEESLQNSHNHDLMQQEYFSNITIKLRIL